MSLIQSPNLLLVAALFLHLGHICLGLSFAFLVVKRDAKCDCDNFREGLLDRGRHVLGAAANIDAALLVEDKRCKQLYLLTDLVLHVHFAGVGVSARECCDDSKVRIGSPLVLVVEVISVGAAAEYQYKLLSSACPLLDH